MQPADTPEAKFCWASQGGVEGYAGSPGFWQVQEEEDCLQRKEGEGFIICEFPNQLCQKHLPA